MSTKTTEAASARRQRFADEYLIDLNATEAAKRAGYSAKTAKAIGCRLLKHPEVVERVELGKALRSQRTQASADDVLRELQVIGFADMRHYLRFGPKGQILLDWSDMPEGATRAIAEVKQERGHTWVNGELSETVTTTFKLHPKVAALQLIARHLGMLNDNLKVEVGDLAQKTDAELEAEARKLGIPPR